MGNWLRISFFQARKKLVKILQSAVTERRVRMEKNAPRAKKDMMDALIEVEDDSGKRLTDEEIIDVLIMYLNAGHESSGHITTWATIFIQEHPEVLKKAKVELEFCGYHGNFNSLIFSYHKPMTTKTKFFHFFAGRARGNN